jgi:hypothetical protein
MSWRKNIIFETFLLCHFTYLIRIEVLLFQASKSTGFSLRIHFVSLLVSYYTVDKTRKKEEYSNKKIKIYSYNEKILPLGIRIILETSAEIPANTF